MGGNQLIAALPGRPASAPGAPVVSPRATKADAGGRPVFGYSAAPRAWDETGFWKRGPLSGWSNRMDIGTAFFVLGFLLLILSAVLD